MKAVGIIAEYNPFHNGHAYQAAEIRRREKPDVIIAAVSGHFTQRGEAASFTKWQRAQLALAGGIDLVVELPFAFAVRSAEYFAAGGIRLLRQLGITHLSFGAESDSLAPLIKSARIQSQSELTAELSPYLSQGIPYAAALSSLLSDKYCISSDITSSPNNILAIEYLKAIERYAPTIAPIHITRYGAEHHSRLDEHTSFTGSSAIRKALIADGVSADQIAPYIPPDTLPLLTQFYRENGGMPDLERLSPFLFGLLATTDMSRLAHTVGISEGLENKIYAASLSAAAFEDLLTLVKTKRYPRTRLARILLHYLFGTTQDMIARFDKLGPQYIRILGMNERGQEYLRTRKKTTPLPLITKLTPHFNQYDLLMPGDDPFKQMLALDVRASNLYARLFDTPLKQNRDFTAAPIRHLL